MKQIYGSSSNGNLAEATRNIKDPKLLILMSNAKQFEKHVEELAKLFPGVPSIGCIGMSYEKGVCTEGVGVTAFTGVTAVTGALTSVSTMPAKDIKEYEEKLRSIRPEAKNTVCIDLCTGNDAAVLSTVNTVLSRSGVQLVGGTGDGGKVCANGQIYDDADVYAFVKNGSGKVKVYKENMYRPMDEFRFIASDTDRSRYYVGKLNGKSAKRVYMETLGIPESAIAEQTFKNPFGKMIGEDMCIISLKEVSGEGLCCFRQVNDSDVLTLLDLRDVREIVQDTINRIRSDFSKVSAVYSVNCVFRYLVFENNHMTSDYLNQMGSLGSHCGLVGFGEHNNDQFVNQTMTCVVFE